MKCPECGTWTEVLDTRMRKDGSRRRRYQCANLHKFNTVERVEEITQGGWRHGNRTGPSSTPTTKEDALSTLPRVDPRMPRLLMPVKP